MQLCLLGLKGNRKLLIREYLNLSPFYNNVQAHVAWLWLHLQLFCRSLNFCSFSFHLSACLLCAYWHMAQICQCFLGVSSFMWMNRNNHHYNFISVVSSKYVLAQVGKLGEVLLLTTALLMHSEWAKASDKVLGWLGLYKGKPASIPSGAEVVASANLEVVDFTAKLTCLWLPSGLWMSFSEVTLSWCKSVSSAAAQPSSPGQYLKRRWRFSRWLLFRCPLGLLYLCLHCGFTFSFCYLCFLMPTARTSWLDELFWALWAARSSL